MRSTRRNTFWRRLPRRICAGVALVAYLIAAIGFPVSASARSRGIPFPCQDHPCGCQSAEQCWRSCCCFTAEERWAWAREHNVEPPAYAEQPTPPKPQAAARVPTSTGWHTVRLRDEAEGRIAAVPSCADCARQNAGRPPCCATKRPPEPPPAPGLRWVGGTAALGCRGLSTVWIASGAVSAPPAALTWQPYTPPADWLACPPENPSGRSLIPPDPPPRFTHS
jgi:hypothetical protein